jgi:hypothetical protein
MKIKASTQISNAGSPMVMSSYVTLEPPVTLDLRMLKMNYTAVRSYHELEAD